MADGLKEVLSKFVPESVLDDAVEAVKETEVSPEWYRADIAKVGARAKQADEFEARLNSIESAPKRKEALKRVGIDYDATPLYGKEALDSIPSDKLDDLNFIAQYVKEKGFEGAIQPQQPGEGNPVEQIVNFSSETPSQPLKRGNEDDFYRELDQIPDGDKEATRRVLEKYGKAQPSEGLVTSVSPEQG